MSYTENPFYERGPVRKPASFFGRRGEVQRLVRAIGARTPQSCNLIGERRLGKTSLLNYLVAPDGAMREFSRLLSRPAADYVFIRADLAVLKTRELNGALFFFRLIFRNLHKTVLEKTRVENIPFARLAAIYERYNDNENLAELAEFGLGAYLDEIHRAAPGWALIFLLDEADALIRQGVGAILRSLLADRPVAYLLATRYPLAELEPGNDASPLFNILAETVALGMLPPNEAHQLVEATATGTGHVFNERELAFILATGGGHPEFLKVIARRVLETGLANQFLHEQMAADLNPLCESLWSGMTPPEQAIIRRLAHGEQQITLPAPALQKLLRKGVLRNDPGGLRLFSPLLADFVTGLEHPTTPVAPPTLRFGDGYVAYGNFVARLSPIEMKLLQHLHEHVGQVCSRDDIHLAVWGEPYTENDAVKVNITVQRMKQKVGQLAEQVEAVRGMGYRWREA